MLPVTSTDLQCNYSNNWFQWNEVEGRMDQQNAQINLSLINLLLFKLLRHVSAT